jgi:hypothetical protein
MSDGNYETFRRQGWMEWLRENLPWSISHETAIEQLKSFFVFIFENFCCPNPSRVAQTKGGFYPPPKNLPKIDAVKRNRWE